MGATLLRRVSRAPRPPSRVPVDDPTACVYTAREQSVCDVPMNADWRKRYRQKLTSPEKAVTLIKPGDRIYLSAGSAVPQGMFPALLSEGAPLGDNQILHLMTLGEAPYTKPQYASRFRHNALFIGANVRQAVGRGQADYTPIFLSELPRLIRSGRLPIDVALISVTPPDEEGYCTFGTHIDLAPAACAVADVVIAQVNPRMPRSCGPARLHVNEIHALVEIEHPLPELPVPKKRPETEAIAQYVAELIPDGATLQLGIGEIPDSILRALGGRRDLGIHTEMFSDGVRELVERGVITGKRKNLHPERIIASFVMGSQRTYEWLDQNLLVELHPVDYTNDPFVIAQNDNMIAINSCLQIDLTGQVCSDSIGARFYSGIGGQVDFIRGAARSKGGKPIIAVPSTGTDGTVSRIVPRLDDGTGVVTTRGDVHWVVTEYGAVNLHGLNVRERAMALISIAHPKFRPWLLAEAKQHKMIYSDQLEPPVYTPIYPKQLETRAQGKDGTPVLIRPIKPTDESLLHDLFYRLSQETIYLRFFSTKKYMPHKNLQRFCTIDYDHDMTLVASLTEGEVEMVVGWATYFFDPQTGFAEASFVVDDAYQGRGLGTALMRRLTEIAEARNIRGFVGEVLTRNTPMMRVFEKCGYPVEWKSLGETIALRIPFDRVRETWCDYDQAGGAAQRPP
jgi:acyl-CoA hydrolase/RimJ/RimL family protein N-acetyltransferase